MDKNYELPLYLFHNGKNYSMYDFMSPHKKGKKWIFRVWAPNAKLVSVVGDFNDWDDAANPMTKISDSVWEAKIENIKIFDNYKFCLFSDNNIKVLKADPYASHSETAPANASKVYDISGYKWTDAEWISSRDNALTYESPINIYEVHLGSWKRYEDGSVLNYRELAKQLIPYVKSMGYTHIEVLPITEYPYDGSWGYQVTGFYAPTSRFGTPKDFMYFVDKCHKAGIGIILDWVIAHFPKDEHGLYEFDGTKLYEVNDEDMCEHKEWGTRIFDYGKNEVKSFLISSAMHWIEKYHIDGIRVDAVASMLYLDYARRGGEWKPNKFGGNYNLEAIEFLKQLNTDLLTIHKGVLMIAEESTAFPMVTKPAEIGGLGFNYKWNMGWMNDMLSYASLDPYFRKDNHNKVTFSITYTYSENYILPLSHDEVVHGKCSLINKMPLSYEDKFEELKAFYGFMIGHPGKKLSFMGNEFGQFIEWNFTQGLDWMLLDYPKHSNILKFVKDLNFYYKKHKEMYELDCNYDGFKWVCVEDNTQNIVSFIRYAKDGSHTLVVVNFSPIRRKNYKMGVPCGKTYEAKLSSTDIVYGGESKGKIKCKAVKGIMHGFENYITLDIEPNSVVFYKCRI